MKTMPSRSGRPVLLLLASLLTAAGLLSCMRQNVAPAVPPTTIATPTTTIAVPAMDAVPRSIEAVVADTAYSNIRAEDYVGPEVCGDCHLKNYKAWQQHPHSKMNQLPNERSVLGDFSGIRVTYDGRSAVFRQEGDQFLVDYFNDQEKVRTFRVTRTVGSRYEQDYVAVQVDGPEPVGDALYTEEIRLRWAWSIVAQRWLPQSYLEPTEYPGSEYLEEGGLRYDPFEPDRLPFNERCARCHNTYPYDLRFYRILTDIGMLSGFPPFPGVNPGLVRQMAEEAGDVDQLGSPRLPMDRFVTEGISCETCHFGGRMHADNVKEQMVRFVPTHPKLVQWTPDHEGARKRPEIVNAICLQCHHSGEAAQDNWPDGSAGVNSMESIEMERGGCASVIKCTDCHNTHVSGPPAGAPDRQEHLAACVDCHKEKATQQTAEAHSRHDLGDASCLDCHMPRIVQGFETYNRSHRISKPTDRRLFSTGMPNACNLCHLDESLAWTREQLSTGWGAEVPISPALRPLFGDRYERPAGEAWLEHYKSPVRTVTVGAYSRSDLGRDKVAALARGLADENAYVRMRHLQGVEAVLGRTLTDAEYDLTGSPARRQAQVDQLLKRFAQN